MEQGKFYEAPKSDLTIEEPEKAGRLEGFLRKLLLVVFSIYSFFTIVFCLFALGAIVHGPSQKSIMGMAIATLMAFFSVKTFTSVKGQKSEAFKYSFLLFMVGFVATTIYRVVFVSGELGMTDFNHFLIFSIPAALSFYYSVLLRTRA